MEYSIITTCDKGYFLFLKKLVDSVFSLCKEERIKNFIVVNTGLSEEQVQYLTSKSEKICFIETGMNTQFRGGIWGADWTLNVQSKTVTLYETVINLDHPVLMLDADMEVLRDLSELLNYGGDIQVCFRPNKETKYIGSYFFAINLEKAIPFIKRWKDLTNQADKSRAFESPSLMKTVYEQRSSLDIVELSENLVNVVSSDLLKEESFLVHYKSKALDKTLQETLSNRLWNIK